MSRRDRHIRLCVALLVLNLGFIWGNSLLPGEASGALSNWVKELLAAIFPGAGMESSGGGLLRKLAHFLEFASLGLLLSWLAAMLQKRGWYALLWGSLAALTDEAIQMFVPDRGPSLRDVGIDTCGILTGMVLLQIGYFLWKRKHSK